MIRLGHTNFGGLFQSFDNGTYQERYAGMMDALALHGLSCEPNNLLFDINPEDMGATPNRILQMLQRPNRPEAIFSCNDMTAFNVYRAAYILGLRIPENLSVFGYDDCTMANFVNKTKPQKPIHIQQNKIPGNNNTNKKKNTNKKIQKQQSPYPCSREKQERTIT